ncbi:exosortase N [Rufibacter sp. XAAS-G3-1]|uniref:exosortase N n=1 Tax=Rufibacter sp. XAAS-G3-1 TaxID=2729134 RepID=UPI0015E638B7|nr:exosortase N [Rufibacter sp. XAAS-G3-1]
MRTPALRLLVLSRRPALPLAVVLGLGYALVAIFFLRQYLLWNPQWLLGLALLPFLALPAAPKKMSWVLLMGAALLLLLAGFFQITTVYFLGFLLVLWFFLQTILHRGGGYALLMLLVASPIFSYLADVGSFPLRLQLTEAAATLLRFSGTSAEAAGNILLLNGEEFSVDPACAGLHMLSFSFMMAIFLLAHQHKTQQKPWPFWLLAFLLLGMLGLNLLANLLRILVLVLLRIGPDAFMHDAVGLLCLVLYAIVPFFFLVKYASRKIQLSTPAFYKTKKAPFSRGILLVHAGLLLCLAGVGYQVQSHKKVPPSSAAPLQVPGFEKTIVLDGVHKFTNGDALIYMKPVRGFYSFEHHPLICWEGSGYLFRHVTQQEIAGKQIYTGTLEKGNDRLHTAWWMDNGQHQTIEQSDWRWRMATGEPAFHLVNVTAATKAALLSQATQLLHATTQKGNQAQN